MPHPRPQLPTSAKESWDANLADLATILSRYKHELEKLLDSNAAKAPPSTPTKQVIAATSEGRVNAPPCTAETNEAAWTARVPVSRDVSRDAPECNVLPLEHNMSDSTTTECKIEDAMIASPGTNDLLAIPTTVQKPATFLTEKWFISAPPMPTSSDAASFRFRVFDAPVPTEPHVLSLDFVPMSLALPADGRRWNHTVASSLRPRCVDDSMWPLPASVSSGYRQKQDHLLHAGLHHRLWSSKSSIAASTTTSI
ncbi:hypothetical protein SPRG_13803 [Saprolegnia parasitica CBS 223.65]|uniref:Uncharacterized protein n=1 Tax=Saprolegnia parasitica (strain CBS 223.65) TaxID=695850 RepID=A0A067BRG1_SAPPC|nr:hypothetical protein SPRG_13803 [Saprolegnia parasitica CBS 223.65]KDO21094.1 hypothetical protein SPRG_13803 [Saprolegnia parasitica CBS 223.65]|eukprot:XP_012208189.1 hypothetical protein SPRG_13803 [Saprolegnia parasitica CBS 223.65]